MSPVMSPPKMGVDAKTEAASAAFCRICLESSCERGDELISPCMCKGTQQFVHRSCLDHWRSVKEGTAFSHCTTCKAQFHLRVAFLESSMGRKMKFRMFVARDILLVFLAIQAAIATIGGLAYLLDRDGKFRSRFSGDWEHIISKHPLPFYYCVGAVVFLALVGVSGFISLCSTCSSASDNYPCYAGDCAINSAEGCFAVIIVFVIIFAIIGLFFGFVAASIEVQRIIQKHYDVLVKKELTKEYVVEDLGGRYTPPKMNPEQEHRVKMLQSSCSHVAATSSSLTTASSKFA